MEDTRYAKTQIYQLNCNDGYFYIGHTINDLRYRLSNHKSDSKSEKNGNSRVYQHIKNLPNQWDDVKIVLIEEVNCKNKLEATARETLHIKKHQYNVKCLNVRIAHLTDEERKAQDKLYQQENLDKQKENQNRYRETHPDKIKAYYEANKEKMMLRNAERIKCPSCDKEVRRDSMSKHKKSHHS